jgi:hypothetical protein
MLALDAERSQRRGRLEEELTTPGLGRSHGSILNFPPTLMTSGHLILEATFGELEARLMSRQPMSPSARAALRDRLFVIRLHTAPCVGMVPSAGSMAPMTFAALRTGLTKMLLQKRLAFHTMQHAAASSHAMYTAYPRRALRPFALGV